MAGVMPDFELYFGKGGCLKRAASFFIIIDEIVFTTFAELFFGILIYTL